MTPKEIRRARRALGYDLAGLARALELQMPHGRELVLDWELGKRQISGPASVAIRLMLERAA